MTTDPLARAIASVERPVQPRPEFADQLLARLEEELGIAVPLATPSRRTWLRPLAAVAAGVVLVLAVVTAVVTLPGRRTAAAALVEARDAFRSLPAVHVRYTTRTDDRPTPLTSDVRYADASRWRHGTDDGRYAVSDGTYVGTFTPAPPVLSVRRYAELTAPVSESGLGVLSPETVWAEGPRTGTPPGQWFDEECTADEAEVLGRAVDRLTCDGGRLRVDLDRATGLVLRLTDAGVVREVTSLDTQPSFAPGLLAVTAPEGAVVRWVGAPPVPPEYARPVRARTVALGADPWALAAADDGVWVVTHDQGRLELRHLDPAGQVRARAQADERFDELILAEGRLWAGTALDAQGQGPSWLRPLDSATGRPVAPRVVVAPGGGSTASMAATPGALWFTGGERTTRHYTGGRTSEDGSLVRLDLRSGLLTTYDVGGDASSVAAGFGAVWVAVNDWSVEPGPGVTVARVDPTTGRATRSFDVPARGVPTVLVPGDRYLYVLSVLGEHERQLLAVDPTSGRVVTQRRVAAGDLAFGQGQLWLTDALRDEASRLDPRTLRPLRTVAVAGGPHQALVSAGALWVLGARDRALTVVPLG